MEIDFIIGQIQATTESQQKQLDDHEERLRNVEDITGVVKEIANTTKEQGANIDKLGVIIEDMKKEQNSNIDQLRFIVNDMKNTQLEMTNRVKEVENKTPDKVAKRVFKTVISKVNWTKVLLTLVGSGTGFAVLKIILSNIK